MPNFGSKSLNELRTLDYKLQRLLNAAIKIVDFSIIEGHRTPMRQRELFDAGLSKTMVSSHLKYPSKAADIAPYPYPKDAKGINQLYFLVGVIKGLSITLNIEIKIGADFNGDGDIRTDKWLDAWHIEIV